MGESRLQGKDDCRVEPWECNEMGKGGSMSNGDGQRLFRYYGNILSMQQAGPTSDGYLSAGDWNRFSNAVTSIFGRFGDVQAQASDYAAFYQPIGNYERALTFEGSLKRDGDIVSLLNDVPANQPPGVNQYYGIAASGQRGWVNFPAYEVPLTFQNSVNRNGNTIQLLGDVAFTSVGPIQ